jgi:hypothetical protein
MSSVEIAYLIRIEVSINLIYMISYIGLLLLEKLLL